MNYKITYRVAKPLKTPFDTLEFEDRTIEIPDAFDGVFHIECTDALIQPHKILVCPELVNIIQGNQTEYVNLIGMRQKHNEQCKREGKQLEETDIFGRISKNQTMMLGPIDPGLYPDRMRHHYMQFDSTDIKRNINGLFKPYDKLKDESYSLKKDKSEENKD